MEIASFYNHGQPGLEMSLGVEESRVLVEAVGQSVISLLDNAEGHKISVSQETIIECSDGDALSLTLFNCTDNLVRDLEEFHASGAAAIDAIMDGRHNPRLQNKWEAAARRRLGVGKTALTMADKLRATQAAQDHDIVTEIEVLGLYEDPAPDDDRNIFYVRSCRGDQPRGDLPVCPNSLRRQRRLHRSH